ncbi:MAG: methyltransferase, partial [Candidatus Altarchaeum sp.]|nr:methyltransferase [Candidatus Altarchaeum sp.]
MKNLTTVKLITHPDVYEPSDDSYLLADILKNYKNLQYKDVLDIGTGTGILAIIAAQKGASVIGADINDKVLEIAKNNANLNNVKIEFRKSDLFENINEKFDLVVFNSPYLPVNDKINGMIERAWNDDGTKEKFFEEINAHLKNDGKFLILLSSLTKISLERYT